MNLILLDSSDFMTPSRVGLRGRRFEHIQNILKAQCGQELIVGQINGLVGKGIVLSKNADTVELDIALTQKPPQGLPVTLIFALPRPPVFKRMLFSAAMLGVKKMIVLHFNRVEKSLWQSSALRPEAVDEQLILGLEQAKDTVMPSVTFKKAFKPFVQDELPALIQDKSAWVAHPSLETQVPSLKGNWRQTVLIIGPEGGIIDYEINLLKSAGCQPLDLGPRILRTEVVLPYILGKFAFL